MPRATPAEPDLERRAAEADEDVRAAAFPVRVGAVDVGSNAIRFVAAEFAGEGEAAVLDGDRRPVRLGHDVFLSGRLPPAAMDAGVEAIRGFRERMEALGLARVRAVATSAVRESRNGGDFVRRVREEAGVELEVITGSEEARLVFLAVRSRVAFGRRKWILVDLGGGSVEVSLADRDGVLWSESHTMGSVRLLEELSVSGDEPGRFQRLLREYAATLRIPGLARQWNPAGLVATGGNIESLARLVDAPEDERGNRVLPLAELRGAIGLLSGLSYRQRVETLGLREDRADVILPAAMVYERVAELCGADRIVVPGVGVKEGVLVDLADDLTTHQEHEDRRDRQAIAGAVALGRRYLFDEAHGAQVARLAGALFDGTEELHGLGPADRRVLLAAAALHDIGTFVSRKKHHKHSLYLISHSEIPEFSPGEIALIANVARYHRKGAPAPHHEPFTDLSADDRERVTRLAALLRVADALDREHVQAVRELRVRVGRKQVTLEVDADGDLLLERWALRGKGGMFADVFGREVVLEGGEA